MLDNLPPVRVNILGWNLAMRLSQTLLCFAVVGALIAAASLPVQAAVITYTDRNAFLAALSSSSADNYDDLTGL